ncbi:MAG TPA: glycosyltransferase, partial [Candidatus Limnocylindria bacterium]|nr:glycosyltransferase [Candidatus Limnocylindria bacterium]
DVAERLGRALLLVGGVYDAAYHARAVAPRVREAEAIGPGEPIRGAVHIGPRKREDIYALLGSAAATLMPVHWDEPFGLVAVESLAAGTPVVAFRRGGLAEIVDERSGALVDPDDVDAFAQAVTAVIGRDPAVCRARAMEFDLARMVARYEELYARVTG